MLLHILLLVGSLILLVVGAEGLVRGSAALALRAGITPLAIALTVVALGTSSPELAVGVAASADGNGGVALGNAIGSNISNLLLILGVSAMVRPLRVRPELLRREVPVLIGVTVLLGVLLADGVLGLTDGIVLLVACAGYIGFTFWAAHRDRLHHPELHAAEVSVRARRPAWLDGLLLLGGLAALLAGAHYVLGSSIVLAERLGMSRLAIGLTIVAIGTSLPELATSVVAAVRKEEDVAFGNVFGSNILNILLILGVASVINPIAVEGLRVLDLGVLLGSAVIIIPLMWTGGRLSRIEGTVLLLGYVAYLWSLVP